MHRLFKRICNCKAEEDRKVTWYCASYLDADRTLLVCHLSSFLFIDVFAVCRTQDTAWNQLDELVVSFACCSLFLARWIRSYWVPYSMCSYGSHSSFCLLSLVWMSIIAYCTWRAFSSRAMLG